MSDAWGGHRAAAYDAIDAVGEVQDAMAQATDACDRAMGAIMEAVGQSQVESATNALQFVGGIKDRVEECFGMSQQAVADLDRYAGGF